LISYDGDETRGLVYECAFDSKYPIQEMATHSGAVSMIRLSHSGRYLLTGSSDGQVGIRPIAEGSTGDQFFLAKCWKGHMHGQDSRVTGCGMSYDEGKLVTCALDGSIHMLKISEGFSEAARAALSSAQALKEKEVAAAALLLEDLKAKEEEAAVHPEPEVWSPDT
jgi:WD40 repeat protein